MQPRSYASHLFHPPDPALRSLLRTSLQNFVVFALTETRSAISVLDSVRSLHPCLPSPPAHPSLLTFLACLAVLGEISRLKVAASCGEPAAENPRIHITHTVSGICKVDILVIGTLHSPRR